MTMNNETKLTTEQRIQRSIEHNEAKLQKAEEKRKQLKEQRRALEKQAYENRLTTRAIMLEEFLQEPEILTNEDVRNYLAYLFKRRIISLFQKHQTSLFVVLEMNMKNLS